ncbi:MAG: hypothetical protein LBU31_02400, partial [Coriobacteriales bacterium]|nr:hypothetical protein [Coriobacteriales bacterium]
EARADIAAIQLEANQRQQEFLGWYTSPDGFGGVRVDDAFLLGFLAVFPTEDLSLFAHWGSLPDPPDPPDTPDPPDPPDTPDPPDLPDPPDTPDPPDAPDPPDPPVAPTTPTIPETPSSPETPSEPGGPTSRTREAQGTSSALSSPSAPGPTESTPTAPQDEPQSPSEADRTSQHAAQVILDQMVPLSNLLPTATPFISLGQSPESWSVGNGALCLAGLAEAALVLATYLRRFRRGLASANKMVRLLRALVISLPILALIATGFSSSFAKPAVFFDTASPAIIMLFGIQQMVFFSLRQAEKATMAEGVRDKRFRMVERFEAKKDKSSFKVHKKS